jgi:hypothetical protein
MLFVKKLNVLRNKSTYNTLLTNMEKIGIDVWQIILELLDFKTQMSLVSCCQYCWHNVCITNLYDIDQSYLKKLTSDILKYWIFRNVVKLGAYYSSKITDVSFMKSLKKVIH